MTADGDAPLSEIEALRIEVVDLLETEFSWSGWRGTRAEHWHSGGGIFGIRVVSPTGRSELFLTLDGEGHDAWTGCDWNDQNGEIIGTLQIQVRPFDCDPRYGPAGTPEEFAEAIENVVRHLA